MISLRGKKILVTGGGGFLGKYVVDELKKNNPKEIVVPDHSEFDLRKRKDCQKAVKGVDIVIHLAAQIGGIGFIDEIPADVFYNNAIMGIELMEAARLAGVKKFVSIGTVCEYPKFTPIPFEEKYLWDGYPEETTAPYGWAKKILIVQGSAYRKQYNFNAIHLMPVNLYGPGDDFSGESSHVIPALIKRIIKQRDLKKDRVSIWGTGKATREFLYVADAARGIVLATQNYEGLLPVNLGTGVETPIKKVTEIIMKTTGFKGKIVWDRSKPDGQPRRRLDVSVAAKFGFKAQVGLEEGLRKTIEWYEKKK